MAKWKAVILPEKDAPEDKKYPLEIRVTNNRVLGYIPTGWYVSKADFELGLTKSGKIVRTYLKDRRMRQAVDAKIQELEELCNKLFGISCKLGGDQIAESLKSGETVLSADSINFIKEFENFILLKEKQGKKGPASNYQTSLNHLLSFIKKDSLSISNVTYNFLKRFETFLQDQAREKGVEGRRSLSLTMSCVRRIFNNCRNKYNDEDKGIVPIAHYPFKKYKIEMPDSELDRSVKVEYILKTLQAPVTNSRDILAQKYFKLSLFLMGTHCADFYEAKKQYRPGKSSYRNGRFAYKRSKTRETRKDGAFISMKVPREIKPLFEEFLDKNPKSEYLFTFHERYGELRYFRRAVNIGLRHIAEIQDIAEDLTSYTPRCSLARIAETALKLPTSDIAELLNHSTGYQTTEIYTKKDFEKIDAISEKLLNYIFPYRKDTIENTQKNDNVPSKSVVVMAEEYV